MGETNNNKFEMLTTHKNELVKQYIEYDGFNRMSKCHVASTLAVNGAPCITTEYAYDGVSTRIAKTQEYPGTWNSSWDI